MEVVGEEIAFAYANDLVILGNTQQEVTFSFAKTIEANKNVGLCINEENT